jgi:hypothetical protein
VKNALKIIEVLRTAGPLDDDELSAVSGVRPRQQVNQICRRLEANNILSRKPGRNGKILNVLKQGHHDVEITQLASETRALESDRASETDECALRICIRH